MPDDDDDNEINGTFARALANTRDVSIEFWATNGFDEDRAVKLLESETIVRRNARDYMESGQGSGRLFSLAEDVGPHINNAHQILDEGKVAAVDGTDALAKLDFMMTTQYACAVGWITSQERGTPHIRTTETISDYLDPDALRQRKPMDMLADLYVVKDEARVQQSWPSTYREYQERHVAANICTSDIVLLDGPIFTQNLMMRLEGRLLYDAMLKGGKWYIGIIKELNGSWPECVFFASALRRGEGYIICPVGVPARQRSAKMGSKSRSLWIEQSGIDNYVRVVYRPAEKSFAFECPADRVFESCAILLADASPTLNHELSLLMETVDAQLRSGFNASAARDIVLTRLMNLPRGYQSAIDATNERSYR